MSAGFASLPLHDAILWWTGGIVFSVLLIAAILSRLLLGAGRIGGKLYRELIARIQTWAVIVPVVLIPIGFGTLGIRAATSVLGLLCFREFSRASGLFQSIWLNRAGMVAVVLFTSGIAGGPALALAVSAVFASLAIVGLISCEPPLFLKHVSLSGLAVAWFGICLGTLGDLAIRDGNAYIVLWLVICVELNDVAAFVGGKLVNSPKLCPQISPGKTVGGALSGLVATTLFAGVSASWYWHTGPVWVPFVFGFLVALAGQLGDLVVSGVKRSLGVKDLGDLLPGHGGVLDRCDSLLLASPTALMIASILSQFPD